MESPCGHVEAVHTGFGNFWSCKSCEDHAVRQRSVQGDFDRSTEAPKPLFNALLLTPKKFTQRVGVVQLPPEWGGGELYINRYGDDNDTISMSWTVVKR